MHEGLYKSISLTSWYTLSSFTQLVKIVQQSGIIAGCACSEDGSSNHNQCWAAIRISCTRANSDCMHEATKCCRQICISCPRSRRDRESRPQVCAKPPVPCSPKLPGFVDNRWDDNAQIYYVLMIVSYHNWNAGEECTVTDITKSASPAVITEDL